jgi:hypothetical protein
MRTNTLSLALGAALLLTASTASATRQFPRAIQSHLGLASEPPCSLCHLNGNTGGGTVTTPFGRSARDRSLVADNADILDAILDQMKAERVDSDADGVPDIDELIAGTDPNSPPDDSIGPQTYGCAVPAAAAAGSPPRSLGAAGAAVGVALWLAARRRRRALTGAAPYRRGCAKRGRGEQLGGRARPGGVGRAQRGRRGGAAGAQRGRSRRMGVRRGCVIRRGTGQKCGEFAGSWGGMRRAQNASNHRDHERSFPLRAAAG